MHRESTCSYHVVHYLYEKLAMCVMNVTYICTRIGMRSVQFYLFTLSFVDICVMTFIEQCMSQIELKIYA